MLNEITIMGRMVQTPELRATPSGIETTTFTVACDRDHKDADGNRETDFIDVVAWRDTAKFISRYFQKGQSIIVTGRLEVRSWVTKEGDKRKTWEVKAGRVWFGGPKPEEPAPAVDAYTEAPIKKSEWLDMDDPDLPF